MVNEKRLKEINPLHKVAIGYDKITKEKFAEQFKKIFPNFPDEVIEQWPYRAFCCFLNNMEIEYDRLKFSLVEFDNEQIMQIKASKMDDDDLINWGKFHLYEMEDPNYLKEYMLKEKKFPAPIIVLDTLNSNIDGNYNFKRPYHLLEGHRRLSFIKTFINYNEKNLPDKQYIWLAKRY